MSLVGTLTMKADAFYIPKNNPQKPLGEDSYFINKEAQVIGVADGVGSWSKKGIDSGEYARELMRNATLETENSTSPVDPKGVLLKAFLNTGAQGTSTACIVALLHGTNNIVVRAANLGDSGFAVIRKGKTVYRSPIQQHKFSCPYQIGKNSSSKTRPEEADEIEVPVEEGDVVIVGTDGLFDNLFPEEIEELAGLFAAEQYPPGLLARSLAMAAHEKSLDERTVTPFGVAAFEALKPHFGGKYDDITVVAAYICAA